MTERVPWTMQNREPQLTHVVGLTINPVPGELWRIFIIESERPELMRLNPHEERLLRKAIIKVLVPFVDNYLSVRKALMQWASTSDMVEMAVGQCNGLQLEPLCINEINQFIRGFARVDADSFPRFLTCNDSRILLKRG